MIINGESKSLNESITIVELLIKLNYNPAKVAVELNGEIVLKKDYENIKLSNNDVVEVVSFVGGG